MQKTSEARGLKPGFLCLEDGTALSGFLLAGQESVSGEVVFTTGMTGYPESLTDPSFAGQILVFTYPLVGNYGVTFNDLESEKIHARGVIISEMTSHWSHREGQLSFCEWLDRERIPLLIGVDTRELVKRLRINGTLRGTITAHAPAFAVDELQPHLVQQVSTNVIKIYSGAAVREGGQGSDGKKVKRIIAVDCGMKKSLLSALLQFPVEVVVVPADYDYVAHGEPFDGLFISNGPGDPAHCTKTIEILAKAMSLGRPIFGVCLGCQLMALAAGALTKRLKFGHRGQNVPVMHLGSSRCYITSQNHGYAVDEASLSGDWEVSFRNLNDGTVEGITHRVKPFSAVQFHPEAAPGPTETRFLFERFYQCL